MTKRTEKQPYQLFVRYGRDKDLSVSREVCDLTDKQYEEISSYLIDPIELRKAFS